MLTQKSYQKIKVLGINTSNIELEDLGKAWLAISVAFAIAFSGLNLSPKFLLALLVSAFTVGIGFLFHELAHKLVAQKYGCHSEFRANRTMLLVAIITSFFGLVIAAPGAVFIATQHVGKTRNGKISMAGPLTNLILALVFLLLYFLFTISIPFMAEFAKYGFIINTLLGGFNLIPIPGFDGSKVLRWDKRVYGLLVGFALILFVVQGAVF